ncbi:MAG TPA: helix-hairpin-helix domain-containing protein [Saprospiraceae bacterium]|nr:helix-hairpin-helix domain-containing protein [Saprospiraceae bacterium]HMP24876.1 helix-hairpin-helix domain-containing protein [Saprospiraceae bacterium]
MYNKIILLQIAIADCWWWWLLASLGAFLLGLLLGWWLWYKYRRRVTELEAEMDKLRADLTACGDKNKELEYKLEELRKADANLKIKLQNCEADKAILSNKLEAAGIALGATPGESYGVIFKSDNLQIVEGIGAKIEQVLKKAGITNWAQLANAKSDDLTRILEEAGPTYRIHDPATWPQQARLAQEGKWDELIALQKSLGSAGSMVEEGATPSKVEKMATKILGFSNNPEDLKIIEGIGPKIEQLLKDAGINTWTDLSMTSVQRLREVLDAGGESFRLANPGTWPRQAELAAAGKWGELSAYQDFLDGGVEPGA